MYYSTPLNTKRNNKAFSLIELCVVIAVLAILAGIFAPVIASGIDAWIYKIEQDELLTIGRLILTRMVNELRWECDTIDHDILQTATTESLPFNSPDGLRSFEYTDGLGTPVDYKLEWTSENSGAFFSFTPSNFVDRRTIPDYDGDGLRDIFTFFKNDGSILNISGGDTLNDIALIQIHIALRKSAGLTNQSDKVLHLRTSVRPHCVPNCGP